jgi:hypothetical protein
MKTPIDFLCYAYAWPEGSCTLFQFYPNGEWDEDKQTLKEALVQYPIEHYEWIYADSLSESLPENRHVT